MIDKNSDKAIKLNEYGWNEYWSKAFARVAADGQMPARVLQEQKGLYKLVSEFGEIHGEVSGKFRHLASGLDSYPSVGDWVAADLMPQESRAVIHALLHRKSKFSRKVAGAVVQEQIVAANFEYVFIVNSLNKDFNLRRLERYLTMAWESGAEPVIVLSKKDLCEDAGDRIGEVQAITFGVPVIAASAVTGEGIDELRRYLGVGNTVAVLGSSGVGKSTLTNLLAGEEIMDTREIREDDSRGRHTTTYRNLVKLPNAGMIIDTPGMRELQLWESDTGLSGTFGDVESFSGSCRFRDCSHENEPGCAVLEAVRNGLLPAVRLESYRKLKKELRFIEGKHNQSIRMAERKNSKDIAKYRREIKSLY
ncbi:MAG TPA: ribosome small subunit-dependent GTPase A [Clostridia bacterium]|nr:ribosome small subunit-dependent GTPase A [Clostridia bacterium]